MWGYMDKVRDVDHCCLLSSSISPQRSGAGACSSLATVELMWEQSHFRFDFGGGSALTVGQQLEQIIKVVAPVRTVVSFVPEDSPRCQWEGSEGGSIVSDGCINNAGEDTRKGGGA